SCVRVDSPRGTPAVREGSAYPAVLLLRPTCKELRLGGPLGHGGGAGVGRPPEIAAHISAWVAGGVAGAFYARVVGDDVTVAVCMRGIEEAGRADFRMRCSGTDGVGTSRTSKNV